MPRKSTVNVTASSGFMNWQPLPDSFYRQENVVQVARDLLGKILVTHFQNTTTAGRIVETEAYAGITDKASHAWNGRRTARTEIMYAQGGTAYVYLCYGMHHLFNVVTNEKDVPHAVLVRAVEPLAGIEHMLLRTGKPAADFTLTRGPGNVAKALGISTAHTGLSIVGSNDMYIATDQFSYPPEEILATPRIGVAYAAADALLPYRFIVKGNRFVSATKNAPSM